ncbi:Transmembrane domain-containing protein [Orpheovirus IHUMI-LCC2]|uniref:Transmembrane domain-containing protein n=1 Tax=Orpheovirus IHUMI-LCC2 TaxID=2023057 RepID=A0A2I2L635_9VIRU|nr:Transmembrane domain-containing protein [Orpheovirus IHUMI-LCC2]SNW62994.1 Transmembrane domain-containing protein [Orpheovirus IHUMI-LCC2]
MQPILEEGIDFSDITRRLDNLKRHSDVLISELSGSPKHDYDTIQAVAQTLFNTPTYERLYKCIRDRFHDITNPNPGTIGAYFNGCSLTEDACSPLCAGSIVPPDADWKWCDTNVVLGIWNGKCYDFYLQNPPLEDKDTTVNLESVNGQFYGLTTDEKESLKSLGIFFARFRLYHRNNKYEVITKECISVDTLKSRNNYTTNIAHRISSSTNSSSNAIFWVFAIILLLVIIYLVWYFYSGSMRSII